MQRQEQLQEVGSPGLSAGRALDSSVWAAAQALQQQVSAQLASASKQQRQPGGSDDSCPESAVADSQLQQLSPAEVAGPSAAAAAAAAAAATGRGQRRPTGQAPTPQSRRQRLSPPVAAQQPKQQQQQALVAPQAALVPVPAIGSKLLYAMAGVSGQLCTEEFEIESELGG
jgi:hypothetical protein